MSKNVQWLLSHAVPDTSAQGSTSVQRKQPVKPAGKPSAKTTPPSAVQMSATQSSIASKRSRTNEMSSQRATKSKLAAERPIKSSRLCDKEESDASGTDEDDDEDVDLAEDKPLELTGQETSAQLVQMLMAEYKRTWDELKCCVCYSYIGSTRENAPPDPAQLPCGHTFCLECLQKQVRINRQCPTCRKTVTLRAIKVNEIMRTCVDNLRILAPDAMQQKEQYGVLKRMHASGGGEGSSSARSTSSVHGGTGGGLGSARGRSGAAAATPVASKGAATPTVRNILQGGNGGDQASLSAVASAGSAASASAAHDGHGSLSVDLNQSIDVTAFSQLPATQVQLDAWEDLLQMRSERDLDGGAEEEGEEAEQPAVLETGAAESNAASTSMQPAVLLGETAAPGEEEEQAQVRPDAPMGAWSQIERDTANVDALWDEDLAVQPEETVRIGVGASTAVLSPPPSTAFSAGAVSLNAEAHASHADKAASGGRSAGSDGATGVQKPKRSVRFAEENVEIPRPPSMAPSQPASTQPESTGSASSGGSFVNTQEGVGVLTSMAEGVAAAGLATQEGVGVLLGLSCKGGDRVTGEGAGVQLGVSAQESWMEISRVTTPVGGKATGRRGSRSSTQTHDSSAPALTSSRLAQPSILTMLTVGKGTKGTPSSSAKAASPAAVLQPDATLCAVCADPSCPAYTEEELKKRAPRGKSPDIQKTSLRCTSCRLCVHVDCYAEHENEEAGHAVAHEGEENSTVTAMTCALCLELPECKGSMGHSRARMECVLCPCAPPDKLVHKPDALYVALTGQQPPAGRHVATADEARALAASSVGTISSGSARRRSGGSSASKSASPRPGGRGRPVPGSAGSAGRATAHSAGKGKGKKRDAFEFGCTPDDSDLAFEMEYLAGSDSPEPGGHGAATATTASNHLGDGLPAPAAILTLTASTVPQYARRPTLDGGYAHARCCMYVAEVFHLSVATIRSKLAATLDMLQGKSSTEALKAQSSIIEVLERAKAGCRSSSTSHAVRGGKRKGRPAVKAVSKGKKKSKTSTALHTAGDQEDDTGMDLVMMSQAMRTFDGIEVLEEDEEEEDVEEAERARLIQEAGEKGQDRVFGKALSLRGWQSMPCYTFTAHCLSQMLLFGWLVPPEVSFSSLSSSAGAGAGTAAQDWATALVTSSVHAADKLLSDNYSPSTLIAVDVCCPNKVHVHSNTGTCEVCGLYGARNGITVQCSCTREKDGVHCMRAYHPLCADRAGLFMHWDELCCDSADGQGSLSTPSYCSLHSEQARAQWTQQEEQRKAARAAKAAAKQREREAREAVTAASRAAQARAKAEAEAVKPRTLASSHKEELRALYHTLGQTDKVGPGKGLDMGYAPAHERVRSLPLRIPEKEQKRALEAYNRWSSMSSRERASVGHRGPGVGYGAGVPGPYHVLSGAHWPDGVQALVSTTVSDSALMQKATLAALAVWGMAWLAPEQSPGFRASGSGSSGGNRVGVVNAESASGSTSSSSSSSSSTSSYGTVQVIAPSHVLTPCTGAKFTQAQLEELARQADNTPVWAPAVLVSGVAAEKGPQAGSGHVGPSANSGATVGGRGRQGSASTAASTVSIKLARRPNHAYYCSLATGATLLDPSWVDFCEGQQCMPETTSNEHVKRLVLGDADTPAALQGPMLLGKGSGVGQTLQDRLLTRHASARARTEVDRAKAHTTSASSATETFAPSLLFSGITFVLYGEWEDPPHRLARGDAAELITLCGGRYVDVGLGKVQWNGAGAVGATPSLEDLRKAALGSDGDTASPGGVVRPSGLSCPIPSSHAGSAAASGEQGTPAQEWAALLMGLARQHRGAFVPLPASAAPAALCTGGRDPACPPLVLLCDWPLWDLPQPVLNLLAIQAQGGSKYTPVTPVLTPEWLLDCVATYSRLAPPSLSVSLPPHMADMGKRWLHPAYRKWLLEHGMTG